MIKKEDYKIGKASEYSESEINAFKKILLDADEVPEEYFDGLIKKDPVLMFIVNQENIEAVGALKLPHNTYREKVFANSKSEYNNQDYKEELGWIVVKTERKGLGKKLVQVLSKYNESIYSTVREENVVMRHILERFGFMQTGKPYKSSRGNYNNVLYVLNN